MVFNLYIYFGSVIKREEEDKDVWKEAQIIREEKLKSVKTASKSPGEAKAYKTW